MRELLARLRWERDPERWTVRCRDGLGRRARLLIGVTGAGITITATAPGPWQLSPLESGRLRGVVRDALLSPDGSAADHQTSDSPGARGSTPDLAPRTGLPTPLVHRGQAPDTTPVVLPTVA